MPKSALLPAVISALISATTPLAAAADAAATPAEQGKAIAFNRELGNCLACHEIKGGESPGNIGPPLVNMQARYSDKAELRKHIWDETVFNPNTIMPPFGRHQILTEPQLDLVVEFIYQL
jgi:sulfur-oxidizing protein SoxX